MPLGKKKKKKERKKMEEEGKEERKRRNFILILILTYYILFSFFILFSVLGMLFWRGGKSGSFSLLVAPPLVFILMVFLFSYSSFSFSLAFFYLYIFLLGGVTVCPVSVMEWFKNYYKGWESSLLLLLVSHYPSLSNFKKNKINRGQNTRNKTN